MAKILAIRLSALGDIAMTVAVLKSFADIYPEHEITLMSRPIAGKLLEGLPENVHFRPVKLDEYKGIGGMHRLSRELANEGYDAIADMHDVLRTKMLRFFLKRKGKLTARIDKGRKERKQLVRKRNKRMVQLTTSPERYAQVLNKLGYPIELQPFHKYAKEPADISSLVSVTGEKGDDAWVGIAPFAAHKGKIYPLPLMEKAITLLADRKGLKIFLFGSGPEEKQWCETIEARQENVCSLIGKTNLTKELMLMSHMNVMVTMDSANMHLSALAGTPTLSIWGATHPLAGFSGMQAAGSRILQLDMECRPCSIFGNKPCMFGDYRCMARIAPQDVAEAIMNYCKP